MTARHLAQKGTAMKLSLPLRENHIALWTWLAENPKKDKENWPGFRTIKQRGLHLPMSLCFACEQCGHLCGICPLNQGQRVWRICDDDHAFRQWRNARTSKTRSKYARQIAEAWK